MKFIVIILLGLYCALSFSADVSPEQREKNINISYQLQELGFVSYTPNHGEGLIGFVLSVNGVSKVYLYADNEIYELQKEDYQSPYKFAPEPVFKLEPGLYDKLRFSESAGIRYIGSKGKTSVVFH